MSLKGFHLVFVTVATLMFAFLTLWSFMITAEESALSAAMGYIGIGGLIVMPFYGVYFLRKAKQIHLD